GDRAFTTGYLSISAWDTATGQRLHSFELPPYGYGDPLRSYSPNGRYALSFEGDFEQPHILVWDVAARQNLHTFRPPPGPFGQPTSVFSPDSSLLATCYWGKEPVVCLRDLHTGKELRSFKKPKANWVRQLFFMADGKTLLMAGARTVGLDIASGKELFSWRIQP